MKICSIRIKGFQQFDDIFLDFTNPETGEPVEKVCFIGRNGTGKSTILRFLNEAIPQLSSVYRGLTVYSITVIISKVKYIFFYSSKGHQSKPQLIFDNYIVLKENIENENGWFEDFAMAVDNQSLLAVRNKYKEYELLKPDNNHISNQLIMNNNSSDLLIYSPAESQINNYCSVNDVPKSDLDSALKLFGNHPFYNEVSEQNVSDFWKQLIFLTKSRENERNIFENRPENLSKTKKELIEEFEKEYPKILDRIAKLWNKILDKAGLEFDIENARNPIQLTDNLQVYIKHKELNRRINYNQLSTGIRNFMFRIGHIYSLYFNREIKRGFLLVDEPENSLFPDFLFDLVKTYQEIVIDKNGENNTQMFFSTHSPIIAAQFEPYERILLEWDDTGYVKAFKGTAPAGDDPNDLLIKDFKLKNVMGEKGQEMWKEYLSLKKKLRKTTEETEKTALIEKITKIGNSYNFGE
ncbi:MAG: ATP-binding protein [Bacteroidetes bacterium]|nr:ATP-binding protein [Bacteroidota bacterium]MBU1721067.1 ATP-binding protein [Bacteroidota bacterium]